MLGRPWWWPYSWWYGPCSDDLSDRDAADGSPGLTVQDPEVLGDLDVRFVQPYQAVKTYICPGCNRDIPAGQGHMVVVPTELPDLRRHWHRGCWTRRRPR
jgi:hypothetical protein